MKKSKDEVIEILNERQINDYGFIRNCNGDAILFEVILDCITWKELKDPFIRYNIIDITAWNDENIRITIENVIEDC